MILDRSAIPTCLATQFSRFHRAFCVVVNSCMALRSCAFHILRYSILRYFCGAGIGTSYLLRSLRKRDRFCFFIYICANTCKYSFNSSSIAFFECRIKFANPFRMITYDSICTVKIVCWRRKFRFQFHLLSIDGALIGIHASDCWLIFIASERKKMWGFWTTLIFMGRASLPSKHESWWEMIGLCACSVEKKIHQ